MANRIRELRKAKRITMKQLGEAVDLAESTISQYETGKREPDNATLCRISDFFGVSVDYLLGRDVHFALYGDTEITGDVYDEITAFAECAKNRKKKAPSKDEAELQEFMQLYEQLSPEHRSVLLAAAKGFAQEK